MARPTRRRGTVNHQFRKRVPADVLQQARGRRVAFRLPDQYGGDDIIVSATISTEITFSLRTADRALAKQRQAIALAQFDTLCEAIRSGPKPLSNRQQVALSGLIYRAFADGLGDNPGNATMWEAVQAANRAALSGASHALGIYATETERREAALEDRFGRIVDAVLQREGVITDAASRRALLVHAGNALTDAAERLQRNAEGDYSPDNTAARFPAWHGPDSQSRAAQAALTFTSLFERWRLEAKPAPNTVTSWGGCVRQFERHLGHDDPRRVTPADVVGWKDVLVERGLTGKGIRDGHLAALKTLFNYGVRNGLMDSNPAQGVTVSYRRRAGETQQVYDDDEVAKLLALARQQTLPARRWIPWLLAGSGARVGEMAQLWGKRIVNVGGIYVMKIAPAEDGGTIKNEGSERVVPLHPELIKQGFLDFVRSRGDGPLFYSASNSPRRRSRRADGGGRHASKGVSNHLAAWIRSNGFTEKRKAPCHAFRHWFKTACTKADVQEGVANAIQGHAGRRTVADGYRHIDIPMMAEAINRIVLPPKVARAPQSADS